VITSWRRAATGYAALASMVIKTVLVYNFHAVIYTLQNLINMVVFVYFWRALYADTTTIAGLTLEGTLTYILLVRIFKPLGNVYLIGEFGYQLEEGRITHLLVRPLHIQLAYYVEGLAGLGVTLGQQLPVLLVALLVFQLHWPTDPAVWAIFILSALIGRSALFCFDWIAGCLAFYTTSTWGLGFALEKVTLFLGVGLVPVVMMPAWLQLIVQNTPFAQALYVPLALLAGLTPLSEAPRLLLIQLAWLAGLLPLSWLAFTVAIRRVTVQGG
jgi:ABC-2 type transport system permease protein